MKKEESSSEDHPTENEDTRQRNRPATAKSIANGFLREIRSIQFAQEETLKVLTEAAEQHRKAFTKFLSNLKSEKEEGGQKYEIPVEKTEELKRLLHDLSSSSGSLSLSLRGLFLVLISKWDAYFGSLLRWIYRIRPEIIDSSSRTITFAYLKQINSIEMARSRIIEDEVGVVLRDSHGDQFEYLERKLSLSLRKVDIWPKFIELTQRRNLIAHADGKISEQYLSICREHNVSLDAKVSLGADIAISPTYLRESCDCLAELGLKLSQVLWRKLLPSEASKADSHLLDATYDMLKAGQYELAIKLLTFSLTPPMKFEEARDRYVCVVNLALAQKWMNNETKCAEIVGSEDWSAASLDFQLAVAILRDRFDEAVRLMRQIGGSGSVTRENYEEWPLFNKFRRTKKFGETYRELFKTDIEIRAVTAKSEATDLLLETKKSSERPKQSRRKSTKHPTSLN